MLDKLFRFIARRAYRAGFADGYNAGRERSQQQSYASGYTDGKRDGRAAEACELRATRAKLNEAYNWGWRDAMVEAADATRDGSQGLTTSA